MATALSAARPWVVYRGVSPATALPALVHGALSAGYWNVGTTEIWQTSHAIQRNYPGLGYLHYILETVHNLIEQVALH
jgi:hypothetical protein